MAQSLTSAMVNPGGRELTPNLHMSRVSTTIPDSLHQRRPPAALAWMFGSPLLRRNQVMYFALASERVGAKCKLAIVENGQSAAAADALSGTKLKELVTESPLQNDDRAPGPIWH